MTDRQRHQLLLSVELYIQNTQIKIQEKIDSLSSLIQKLTSGLTTFYRSCDDKAVVGVSINNYKSEIQQLGSMSQSPYFAKIETDLRPQIYISKYSFPEENIYSWVSPIAQLRFLNPGKHIYEQPNSQKLPIEISAKHTYSINNGQLYKFSYLDQSGKIITVVDIPQERISSFGIQEIIEKLDQFQDQVLRIDPFASLLISGAAGSGKTTLAIHKAAFLTQDIQMRKFFKPKDILLLVQDESSRDYFASVLPKLLLSGVTVTTYAQWALDQLKISDYSYTNQHSHIYGPLLEYHKFLAISQGRPSGKSLYDKLDSVYFDFLDYNSYEAYEYQKNHHLLDRFDLCILLREYLSSLTQQDSPKIPKYSLIIVDEAENYLAEQLSLLKNFLSAQTKSIIYVGDLIQKSYLFTINNWAEIRENFTDNNRISIPSTYRITEQIRSYLQQKGYSFQNNPLSNGLPVIESKFIDNTQIVKITDNLPSMDINAVISNDTILISTIESTLSSTIKVMTVHEAQGVEFDNVIYIHKKNHNPEFFDTNIQKELDQIEQDIFLIGCSRAKKSLHVLYLD